MSYFIHHEPLIRVEDVSKNYSDELLTTENLALKSVSLSFQPGEFSIIFGPSGSGKSTLLNIIAGLERPTTGRVLIGSQDIYQYDETTLAQFHRRKMGMVFQTFNLIKSLNVWENITLPQTADGVPYLERRRTAKHFLKLFNLDNYMYRHPNELSGGEQQRVAIARALINNPLLLLVDEPTGNLDTKSADDVMRILHSLHVEAKHTILLVTHNPNYLHFASRVIYLQDGQVTKQERQEQTATFGPQPPPLPKETYNQLLQYRLADEGVDNLPPPPAEVSPLANRRPIAPRKIIFSPNALADPNPDALVTDLAASKGPGVS